MPAPLNKQHALRWRKEVGVWIRRYWHRVKANPKLYNQVRGYRSIAGKSSWTPKRHRQHFKMLKSRSRSPQFIQTRRKALQTNSFRAKRSLIMKIKWRDAEYQKEMQRVIQRTVRSQTSKIQHSVFNSLCARRFKGQRLNFPVRNYFGDIAFPKAMLLIELDGYFHKDRKAADQRRDRYFRKHGWSVYRFQASWKSLPRILRLLEREL